MIPPDAIGSPAGLARIAAQLAVPRSPSARPGMSLQAQAAAMAANVGSRTVTRIRGVEVRGTLVDMTAAFPVAGALLETTTWLQADRIEQRLLSPGRGLCSFLTRLARLDISTLLRDLRVWPMLCGVALVEPDDDVLAVRGHRLGEREDHTSTTSVGPGSEPVWQMLPRVLASYLGTGRMPKIRKVYLWQPVGVVRGCRAVQLPGEIVFDPRLRRRRVGHRFNDLPLALSEVGLRAKARTLPGIARAQARLAGSTGSRCRRQAALRLLMHKVGLEQVPSRSGPDRSLRAGWPSGREADPAPSI